LSTVILSERKKGDFKDWSDFVARVPGVGERSAAKFSEAGLTVHGDRFSGVVAGASGKPAAKTHRGVRKSDQGTKPAPASKAQPAPAKS
jgi:competence protein ComEA